MKIIYLIAGLYRPAGMERVVTEKANRLAAAGHEIEIVTTEQKGRRPAFALNPSIKTTDLAIGYEDNNGKSLLSKVLLHPFKLMKHRVSLAELLKRERADVVISTFCPEASFLPKIKDGSRKVLEVHFSRLKRLQYGRKGLWALADRIRNARDGQTVKRFDRFVVLTHEDASLWGELLNLRVIPNPRTFSCQRPSDLESRQVLAAGRYSAQKGFDMLLKAWRRASTAGWTLRIAGDGDLSELGDPALLGPDVILGPAEDMQKEYAASSIFALSSRYEGLPMVLLEAQAMGLPCVCFACKCGPRDIIKDGRDGLLVPEGDIDALARALERLIKDDTLRREMGAAAYRNSENYDMEKIIAQWEQLLAELS